MTTKIDDKLIEILDIAVSELTYLPSPQERRAKSAFWARFAENPLCEPSAISASLAARFAGENRVLKWWSEPGFSDWFRNQDEFRQRIEYLAHLGLDTLEQILIDPNPKSASARVNAVKLLMEVAKKMPPRNQTAKYMDEAIAAMTREQLQEFIKKNNRLISGIK